MARNVFISYKYADDDVQQLCGISKTKARNYVDEIENLLSVEDHIYFGEHDGEDLSSWDEDVIWQELKDRIFPTTCTIILISPKMKEPNRYDKSQWIPWEICYSIRETVRNDRKSHRNAILAVVLPDKNGSYDYALRENHCCISGCTSYNRDWMFTIIKENMFNRKFPNKSTCNQALTVWHGECSYIPLVKWNYFVSHVSEISLLCESFLNTHSFQWSY